MKFECLSLELRELLAFVLQQLCKIRKYMENKSLKEYLSKHGKMRRHSGGFRLKKRESDTDLVMRAIAFKQTSCQFALLAVESALFLLAIVLLRSELL